MKILKKSRVVRRLSNDDKQRSATVILERVMNSTPWIQGFPVYQGAEMFQGHRHSEKAVVYRGMRGDLS